MVACCEGKCTPTLARCWPAGRHQKKRMKNHTLITHDALIQIIRSIYKDINLAETTIIQRWLTLMTKLPIYFKTKWILIFGCAYTFKQPPVLNHNAARWTCNHSINSTDSCLAILLRLQNPGSIFEYVIPEDLSAALLESLGLCAPTHLKCKPAYCFHLTNSPCGVFSDMWNCVSPFDPQSFAEDKLETLLRLSVGYVRAFHSSQRRKERAQEEAVNFSHSTWGEGT